MAVGVRGVAVDPNQFEMIRRSTKKTDAHGAQALALFSARSCSRRRGSFPAFPLTLMCDWICEDVLNFV